MVVGNSCLSEKFLIIKGHTRSRSRAQNSGCYIMYENEFKMIILKNMRLKLYTVQTVLNNL
jgi:hypothetical protein